MGQPQHPFGRRDAVVLERPSRRPGLRVTVVAFASGEPRLRSFVHTPDWSRLVLVAGGPSPRDAAERADDLIDAVEARGVDLRLPHPPQAHAERRGAA